MKYDRLHGLGGRILIGAAGVMALLACWPSALSANASTSPVLITEVQVAGATAGEEFIELYNPGPAAVELTGWQVRYQNVTAGSSSLVTAIGSSSAPVSLPAGGYFVLHTATMTLPSGVMGQQYEATLSAADKTIGLFAPDVAVCTLRPRDVLVWRSVPAAEEPAGAEPQPLDVLQRRADEQGRYDMAGGAAAFAFVARTAASPGVRNAALAAPPEAAPAPALPLPTMAEAALPGCALTPPAPEAEVPPVLPEPPAPAPTPSPPVIEEPATAAPSQDPPAVAEPVRNVGLFAPQLSELLPNPAKPQTDANDEYIELYNPNPAVFDASGFVLEAGPRKRYILPEGTHLPPKSFTAFYARDTNLALSNTSGQVTLHDAYGRILETAAAYTTAKDGQAWVNAQHKWQWSATATPGAQNVLRTPAASTARSQAGAAKGTVKTATSTAPAAQPGSSGPGATPDAPADKQPAADDKGISIHPGIFALTGVIAVLYGAYEYRRDLANKLYQFRANRRARAEARAAAKGRRGHRTGQ